MFQNMIGKDDIKRFILKWQIRNIRLYTWNIREKFRVKIDGSINDLRFFLKKFRKYGFWCGMQDAQRSFCCQNLILIY